MGLFQEARNEARREGLQQDLQRGRQVGLQEGLREGLLEAIQLTLEVSLGEAGLVLMPAIRAVQDVEVLKNIQKASSLANSPEEIRPLWEQPTSH